MEFRRGLCSSWLLQEGNGMNEKRVFRRLYVAAIADGESPQLIERRQQQFVAHGASDDSVARAQAMGKELTRQRQVCAKRIAQRELGLRALTGMVAEGSTTAAIQRMRQWNAEDDLPDAAIDAAYELGYAQFDAARNNAPVA